MSGEDLLTVFGFVVFAIVGIVMLTIADKSALELERRYLRDRGELGKKITGK